MKLTAEISLYPLNDNYLEIVKEFCRAVRQHEGLTVVTNAMSTQISGDYERVFDVVQRELSASYERSGKQVLTAKFIVGELDISNLPQF